MEKQTHQGKGIIRIKAFFAALLITALVLTAVYSYAHAAMSEKADAYGNWTSEVKYKAGRIMTDQQDRNTLLLMGSSELQHQKSTPYHPGNIFEGQDTELILVGAGYYQSLFHATLLAALEPQMVNKKAVLILAPQWFRKSGVKAEAYASRFSEENFLMMLENTKLSDETKQYITDRTKKLLKVDPKGRSRVLEYEEEYLGDGSMPGIGTRIFRRFMEEKTLCNAALRLRAYELVSGKQNKNKSEYKTAENKDGTAAQVSEAGSSALQSAVSNAALSLTDGSVLIPQADTGRKCAALARKEASGVLPASAPDFESLRISAAADGEAACGGNQFYVKSSYYNNYIVRVMDEVKDEGINTGYSVSPEYEDYECFLKVCSELGIRPLIVITPVNGYWYDWIGFGKDAREDYYSQVRELAEKYGAETADFSDREYEEYFMEDTIHIGWKGWVDVSEAIYRFAQE